MPKHLGISPRRVAQFLLDFATVYGTFQLALYISRTPLLPGVRSAAGYPDGSFLLLSLVATLLIILIFFWQGVYRSHYSVLQIDDTRRFLRAMLMGETAVFLPFFYAPHSREAVIPVTLALLLIPISLSIQKSLLSAVAGVAFKGGTRAKRLLIMGNGVPSEYLLRRAVRHLNPQYEPVGLLEKDPARIGEEVHTGSREVNHSTRIIGSYENLPEVLTEHRIDEVWVNDGSLEGDEFRSILMTCKERGIEVSLLPNFAGMPAAALDVAKLDGIPIIRPRRVTPRPYYETVKWVIDLVAAGIILLLVSPLFALISLWIRLDSKGPALFRQERVGERGVRFKMFKFRTMYEDAPQFAPSPRNRDDTRITRAGKFLRRTSLDELPQIINVLKGDMSLVGPRPEMPFIVDTYNEFQRIRLDVKPGITGLWQISADRSIPIHQNLDYDLYYIDNRSAMLDMVILWRTVWTAVKGI